MQQLELLLTIFVVPYVGKYIGRKVAYWGRGSPSPKSSKIPSKTDRTLGWAKFMEWKYPVQVVVTSPKTFKTTGAVEVAAAL